MEGDKATQEGTLGWFDMVVDRIRGVDKVEALRRALKDWLHGDDTFDPGKRDDTFTSTVAHVGTDVDFIVTGHTHLERARLKRALTASTTTAGPGCGSSS